MCLSAYPKSLQQQKTLDSFELVVQTFDEKNNTFSVQFSSEIKGNFKLPNFYIKSKYPNNIKMKNDITIIDSDENVKSVFN